MRPFFAAALQINPKSQQWKTRLLLTYLLQPKNQSSVLTFQQWNN
jgi:hypothetical protein